jgi:hypothetical protein
MRERSDSFGLCLLFAAATAGFSAAPRSADSSQVPSSAASMTEEREKPTPASTPAPAETPPDPYRFAPDLLDRLGDLPPTRLDYDRRSLDERETRVVKKLIEASRVIDDLYLRQVAEDNPALREKLAVFVLKGKPGALDAITYFDAMYGPWDRLRHDEPFIGSRAKPAGAAFYPADMTKEELERWIADHPQEKEKFESLVTVIRRDGDRLVAIPYSQYYAPLLADASGKLREAAALTGNGSLKVYLTKLADALLSNDYFASDLAWMDLDSDIEFVLGPYEVYEDSLFNYKSSFESYVTVRDRRESEKLGVYAQHLPDLERHLPIRDDQKNFNRKFESPIRVVQEAFVAGEARAGVQTSAFNLPNDERVRQAKGSKKVLLKNVMEAKFEKSGRPIAERVLDPGQKSLLSFEAYFNQVLFHELSHGLGPGVITGPDGKKVETRLLLKNLFSTIEECKADVVGVWSLLYALDQKWIGSFSEASLFATDAALMFRSMRFGLEEAPGGGTAVQWNWYREKGAIVPGGQGRFRVRPEKFREAVRSLARELLEIEATGDSERAKRLLDRYGKATPEIKAMIGKLKGIPVDIRPTFPAAGEQ